PFAPARAPQRRVRDLLGRARGTGRGSPGSGRDPARAVGAPPSPGRIPLLEGPIALPGHGEPNLRLRLAARTRRVPRAGDRTGAIRVGIRGTTCPMSGDARRPLGLLPCAALRSFAPLPETPITPTGRGPDRSASTSRCKGIAEDAAKQVTLFGILGVGLDYKLSMLLDYGMDGMNLVCRDGIGTVDAAL